ncbi:hypothetical protein ACFWP2_21820 [Kitasatospora sp. NPDC058444]|uniref:hypothetical protein n=1 Tax=Kitasatospora sp. NPDC058444 TaxID=3346504 RepID=UPI003648D7FD
MAARRISRGKRLALLLATLVSALFAVLGTGAQAFAAEPLPKPAAAAEGDPTCKAHHAAEALTGRDAGARRRTLGGTAVRTALRAPAGSGVAAAPVAVPTGPVPEANGSRPAALARLQVFRC